MPDAGRVVTGSAGGLRLVAPGGGTRPLADKVKQALFSLVEAELPEAWEGAALDLFAGSGAAGIEALSRGAPMALLVERDGRAAAVIKANLERTGLAGRARIVRRDVRAFLADGPSGVGEAPFATVVIDPPYEQAADLDASLEAVGGAGEGWLSVSACVVAKHFWRHAPPEQAGQLRRIRQRRFGETVLSVYRRRPAQEPGGS